MTPQELLKNIMLQHRKRTAGTRANDGNIFYLSPKQRNWLENMLYDLVNNPLPGWKVILHSGNNYWFYYNGKKIEVSKPQKNHIVIPGIGHRNVPNAGYVKIGKKIKS